MNFEEQSRQYLINLVSQGVFLEANLIGVSEVYQTAKALSSSLYNNQVYQKVILIFKENDTLMWKYFNPVDNTYVNYNLSNDSWDFQDYSKRIVAPKDLIMADIGVKMYGWFQLNAFPIVTKNSNVYLYCNKILPQHQSIVEQLEGMITVQDRP